MPEALYTFRVYTVPSDIAAFTHREYIECTVQAASEENARSRVAFLHGIRNEMAIRNAIRLDSINGIAVNRRWR